MPVMKLNGSVAGQKTSMRSCQRRTLFGSSSSVTPSMRATDSHWRGEKCPYQTTSSIAISIRAYATSGHKTRKMTLTSHCVSTRPPRLGPGQRPVMATQVPICIWRRRRRHWKVTRHSWSRHLSLWAPTRRTVCVFGTTCMARAWAPCRSTLLSVATDRSESWCGVESGNRRTRGCRHKYQFEWFTQIMPKSFSAPFAAYPTHRTLPLTKSVWSMVHAAMRRIISRHGKCMARQLSSQFAVCGFMGTMRRQKKHQWQLPQQFKRQRVLRRQVKRWRVHGTAIRNLMLRSTRQMRRAVAGKWERSTDGYVVRLICFYLTLNLKLRCCQSTSLAVPGFYSLQVKGCCGDFGIYYKRQEKCCQGYLVEPSICDMHWAVLYKIKFWSHHFCFKVRIYSHYNTEIIIRKKNIIFRRILCFLYFIRTRGWALSCVQ